MEQNYIVLLLLVALVFYAKKSYGWVIAAALVMVSGSRLLRFADFSEYWLGMYIAQLVTGIMMTAGQLLRKTDSNAFRLFLRARMHGTNDFTNIELLQLLHFTSLAKRTVMSVSIVLCVLAAAGVMVVRFIESDGHSSKMDIAVLDESPPADYVPSHQSGMGIPPAAMAENSIAYPDSEADKTVNIYFDSTNANVNRLLLSPAVLFPIFMPLLVGLIIAYYLLRMQDSSWFGAIPAEQLQRNPAELPSYIWLFPALSILIVSSNHIFAYLMTF